jgi:ubiquinone/menaquinone biosynthesis C-methylase UbiE
MTATVKCSPLVIGAILAGVLWYGAAPARAEGPPASAPSAPATQPIYISTRPSYDGIGKVYMGREIARVMGHAGADWLERPGREREEAPSKAIAMMGLSPSDVVADIGAGTGYFSFRIARHVPQGKVLAEDIDEEMIKDLAGTIHKTGITNVEPVLGTVEDPKLPENGVDVVLFVDAYHEFDHPREMMEAIFKALKPGGRVIDLEYRAEDPRVLIKPHHKMKEAQAIKEMSAVGLVHLKTLEDLPQQHFMIFQKPG